jgi:hypothetical protein
MYAGKQIKEKDERYYRFIKTLVDTSIKTGYFYHDVNLYNIVDYQGHLSIIDIDFAPVKIHHDKILSLTEYERWVSNLKGSNGGDYFEQMKKLYIDKT